MFPNLQPRLLQIFSARYLEFVPENTLKGDVLLIFVIDITYLLICVQRYEISRQSKRLIVEKLIFHFLFHGD